MHLMVYAPYGRTGIYMLQEFCRRIGIRATDEGIRDLIAALRALPPGHPLEHLARGAGLSDRRRHSPMRFCIRRTARIPCRSCSTFIKRGQLTFGRWIRQAPYSRRCGVMAQIPQATRIAQLPLEDQYAAVELFRGTMVRHSVVVYPNDGPGGAHRVSFAGNAWLNYVPIRMADTVCVQARLPTGAAAVLINRSHSYTDIFMAVDAREKLLYDAIDGRCTIGEILSRTASSQEQPQDEARAFFERLWWHDQVVFDSTQSFSSPRQVAEKGKD